jgi:signal transduction histidine kinase
MIWGAAAVSLITLGVGLILALALRALPTVRLQLMGLAALAVCLPLAAVLLSGWVMFHMGDDVKILAASAASATVAMIGGLFLARSIAGSIDRVRDASIALSHGDLTVRAPESGPAEVADMAESFNEMAANLEQLFDARRELVAWASHDLRTPLANMQAMLEALEDGLAEPDDYLPALGDQVRGLTLLVDDLFELARIDAGALTLELRASPLDDVVSSCLRGVTAEAVQRHISLDADVDPSAVARFAPDKVERVLLNLLTNALRHTPSDGAVAVRVEPDRDAVRVTVEDTGEGLGEEAERRMFDRFWRSDPARSQRGAGLGLAIARGLVEAHGGRIWAENRPGGGARVSFTLPAA